MFKKILFTIFIGTSLIFSGCSQVKPNFENTDNIAVEQQEIESEELRDYDTPEEEMENYEEIEEYEENIDTDLPSSYNISGYNQNDFIYTKEFFGYYNGACAIVTIMNNIEILEDTQNLSIREPNETDRELYTELAENCNTESNGDTTNEDMIDGIQETFDERDIDLEVDCFEKNVFENTKKQILQNKPVILGDASPDINHAYTVIGYKEDNTGKYFLTFTGWAESPYEFVEYDGEYQSVIYYK